MKNIVLIGDSIRLGYQDRVAKLLGDDYKIYSPDENCRFSKYTLWGMFLWMESFKIDKVDAIHWNAGIWDLHRCTADGKVFTPLDEYLDVQKRLAFQMKSYCDNVCFANIIPGGKGLDDDVAINALINTDSNFKKVHLTAPQKEWNADVIKYNEAVTKLMGELNIPVNDLYSILVNDTDKYISSDGIHPTDLGYDALAKQVADTIKKMCE